MNYIGSKFSLLDFLRASISAATGYKENDSYVFAIYLRARVLSAPLIKPAAAKLLQTIYNITVTY